MLGQDSSISFIAFIGREILRACFRERVAKRVNAREADAIASCHYCYSDDRIYRRTIADYPPFLPYCDSEILGADEYTDYIKRSSARSRHKTSESAPVAAWSLHRSLVSSTSINYAPTLPN